MFLKSISLAFFCWSVLVDQTEEQSSSKIHKVEGLPGKRVSSATEIKCDAENETTEVMITTLPSMIKTTESNKVGKDILTELIVSNGSYTTKSVKMNGDELATENVESNVKYHLKPPKGTRDYGPEQMALRNKVLKDVILVFVRHGAVSMDTPVFELKEILTGKYGEESKLIYDLADQGGEMLSLRYDLTVPFARYLAMNKITNIKRYQIGKVYRRDNPSITKARYREFLQCDFDIAGIHDPMLAEVECVRVAYEILNDLNLTSYRIKINHRLLLDGLFESCRIENSKFRSICTAIDKLDKESWEVVREEMLEKEVPSDDVDKICSYIRRKGGLELVEELLKDEFLSHSSLSKRGLEDIRLFLHYCDIYGIRGKISFDLSLARGLDYYTGLIYEFVLETSQDKEWPGLGSVAAGGRYDDLVGTFDAKNKSVPCVGISIGIERLLTVIETKMDQEKKRIRATETEVFVASAQKNMLEERMKIVHELWSNGIYAEQPYKKDPKFLQQMQYCEEQRIPYVVIIGHTELKNGTVKLRNVQTREETNIPRKRLVFDLKKILL